MHISWKEGVNILQLRERAILTTIFICCLSSLGYAADSYEVPRTEYGRPDFQGSWGVRFCTPLERYFCHGNLEDCHRIQEHTPEYLGNCVKS